MFVKKYLFTYLLLLMLVVFGLLKALFHPLKIAGENVLNLSKIVFS